MDLLLLADKYDIPIVRGACVSGVCWVPWLELGCQTHQPVAVRSSRRRAASSTRASSAATRFRLYLSNPAAHPHLVCFLITQNT